MTVNVHLLSQAKGIEYMNVKNTYIKNGMYCVFTEKGDVHKYPMVNIFRVVETYK